MEEDELVSMIDMLLPLLANKEPDASSEGTLDPLGLYQIADALGVKLIPRHTRTHAASPVPYPHRSLTGCVQ
jgi:hypothetical protein